MSAYKFYREIYDLAHGTRIKAEGEFEGLLAPSSPGLTKSSIL